MKVRITRLDPSVEIPEYKSAGAAAFDLASCEDATIAPRSLAILPTGLIIATPPGHVLILAARSSLFKKKGLMMANGIGVIDSDYCGPTDQVHLALYNPGDQEVKVEKNERLVQGFIVPVVKAEFEEGLPLNNESRGGFGSTG